MVIHVRGVPVFYEEAGAGRPLLVLHGKPLDHHYVAADMEPLFENRAGWRRLYPDLPGMGRTPGADWIKGEDHMLEIVSGFVDAVAPGERFVAAGTSAGGYLARGLLHRRQAQMDGLLLIVADLPEPENGQRPAHQVITREPGFEATLQPDERSLLNFLVVQDGKMLEHMRVLVNPAAAIADHAFLEQITDGFAFDIAALDEPFLAPALMVCGRQDAGCGFHGAARLIDDCPRGTLAVLDRAGHMAPVEQSGLFRALVSEWLDRVEEYAPIRGGAFDA